MAILMALNGYIGYAEKDSLTGRIVSFVKLGKDFNINYILNNIDNNEVKYGVEITRLGSKEIIEIPKNDAVDTTAIKKWANEGLDVNSSNAKEYTRMFWEKEDKYVNANKKVYEIYSVPGIKKCIDENNQDILVYAGDENPVTGATYADDARDLEPQGTFDEWLDFVKGEMQENVRVQFIIAFSFAAMFTAILSGEADVDNIIVHLRGDSSSGKSTMICLAVSVYGNPDERGTGGLVYSWNATRNALIKCLMNVNGLLFGLDEFSMFRDKDVSSAVYSIASGTDKNRLRKDATIQKRSVGNYMVLSTGEASILNRCNGNVGLEMRVLEFDSQKWTQSAEQSERIKRFVKKHYGSAAQDYGLKLGRWMQEHGKEKLLELYENWRNYYCGKCIVQARKERISGRYALILMAAYFFNKFYGSVINTKELCDFLIENEAVNGSDRNSYNNFYERLVSEIEANFQHFARPEGKGSISGDGENVFSSDKEQWGAIEKVKEVIELPNGCYAYQRVYISVPYFERIVSKLGYEDPTALKKWLKKSGYSVTEKDRDTVRKMIKGVTGTYICVYTPTEEKLEEDIEEDEFL